MRLHERVMVTRSADVELGQLLIDWIEKHDLTWNEAIRLLLGQTLRWSHYPICVERHGNRSNKKADEA